MMGFNRVVGYGVRDFNQCQIVVTALRALDGTSSLEGRQPAFVHLEVLGLCEVLRPLVPEGQFQLKRP